MKLVIEAPNREKPGFLRRQKTAFSLMHRFKSMQSGSQDFEQLEALMDEMAVFLLDYIVEPADRDEAMDAVRELSQQELEDAIGAVTTAVQSPPLAPASVGRNGADSTAGLPAKATKSRTGSSS